MLKFVLLACLFLHHTAFCFELDESTEVSRLIDRLSSYSLKELKEMKNACLEIKHWYRLLDLTKSSLHDEILKKGDVFSTHKRFPKGDVFDGHSYSKFFYHAHRDGEHGHFHLFIYEPGMNKEVTPIDCIDKRHVAHLIAISMDANGFPKGLFTINQWVTNEAWYSAEDTSKLLPKFAINHLQPSYPLNRWITAMVCAFKPQIEDALYERDKALLTWREKHPDKDVYKDREIEIPSSCEISLEKQVYAMKLAIKKKRAFK